jgi:hypothetical protein
MNGAGSNGDKSNDPTPPVSTTNKRNGGTRTTATWEARATASGDARTTIRGRAQQGRAWGVFPRAHMYVFSLLFCLLLLIFTFFPFYITSRGSGRGTSRNVANSNAGVMGPRERGTGQDGGGTMAVPMKCQRRRWDRLRCETRSYHRRGRDQ